MARKSIYNNLPPAEKKKKSALYIRVSTVYQQDADSLPMQRKDLIAYSTIILGIEDYVVFEDAGFSGKDTNRPGYQEMFSRIRTGEFTHLLVWKIDRISRNLLDFADMFNELKALKVTFISKNEQFDTSSAMGEAMLKIILVFAELERKMTSERVIATMLARAKEGKYNGGKPAFGYRYDKTTKQFLPHPQEAEIVPYIYNLYETCRSMTVVVQTLNRLNIPPRDASKKWSATVVQHILRNPIYIGKIRYTNADQTIITDSDHQPLISQDQFDRIQSIIDDNSKIPASHRPNTFIHPFAGICYCGICGHLLTTTPTKLKVKTRLRTSVLHCGFCAKTNCETYVYDNTFANLVLQFLFNLISAYQTFSGKTTLYDLRRRLHRGKPLAGVQIDNAAIENLYHLLKNNAFSPELYDPPANVSVSDLQQKLDTKRAALDRLNTVYLAQKIDNAEYQKKSARLSKEISNIELSIRFTPGSADLLLADLIDAKTVNYIDYLKKYGPAKLRHFLHASVNKIYITDRKITSLETKNGLLYSFSYTAD